MIDPASFNLDNCPWVPLKATNGFPEDPAIYFAIDSSGTIQYIGRSINIRARWKNHHRYEDLERIGGVRIAYLFIDAPELLPEIEALLISWFDPPLNTAGKPIFSRSDKPEQTMPKKPKAEASAHGELKSPRQFTMTNTGSDMIDELATIVNLSRSEFVERSIRWIYEHWDAQLKREIGYKNGDEK